MCLYTISIACVCVYVNTSAAVGVRKQHQLSCTGGTWEYSYLPQLSSVQYVLCALVVRLPSKRADTPGGMTPLLQCLWNCLANLIHDLHGPPWPKGLRRPMWCQWKSQWAARDQILCLSGEDGNTLWNSLSVGTPNTPVALNDTHTRKSRKPKHHAPDHISDAAGVTWHTRSLDYRDWSTSHH